MTVTSDSTPLSAISTATKTGSPTRMNPVAMGSTMTERFNVAGAMLAKLFGRPGEESGLFAERAAKVRDIGVVQAMYGSSLFIVLTLLASMSTAVVYGEGGELVVRGACQS